MRTMRGFWDDNLDVPTVDLSEDISYLGYDDTYDARDAWVDGTGTMPIDTTVLDANDALAQSGGSMQTFGGSDDDWNLRDIVNAGTGILREVNAYRATSLPDGSRIFTRTDAAGRPVQNTHTTTLNSSDLMTFMKNNAAMLMLGGAALFFMMKKGK